MAAAMWYASWPQRLLVVGLLIGSAALELACNADFQHLFVKVKRQPTVAVPVPLPRPGKGLLRAFDDTSAPAAAAANDGAPAPPLRIVTWNIERGYALEKLIAHLKQLQPDIALLQEVDIDCVRTGGVDVCAEIAKAVGLPYVYFTTEYFVGKFSETVHFDGGRDSAGRPVLRGAAASVDAKLQAAAASAAASDTSSFDERPPAPRNAYGAHGNAILSRYPFIDAWHYTLPPGRGYWGGLADDKDPADSETVADEDVSDADDDGSADAEESRALATPVGNRSPPLCAGGYKAHDPRYVRRTTACARILTPHHGTVAVFSVHLDANFVGARGRARQFHALMRNVTARTRRGDRLVLGGDFNTMSNGYRRWIYKFACDDLRWNSLGQTEAQWFAANVLRPHYPQLHDPTERQHTLRILLGALADDKLDWLLFGRDGLRLLDADERKEAAAAPGVAGARSRLYGRGGTNAAKGHAEQSWAISGYGSSDHCYVCFDLATTD